tara:strand:- start:260 stop:874 length:615 start_codon:yes stop_codon:yes gene_type:complete
MTSLKDQNQKARHLIKRLKILLPSLIFLFLFLLVFQYADFKNIFNGSSNYQFLLSNETGAGVVKPFLQGRTASGETFKITANKASPLGPELKDIELEKVYLEFSRGNNILLKLNSNFAKYLASDNSAIFYDQIKCESFEGYEITANTITVNLSTSISLFEGKVKGQKGDIFFEAGKMEVEDKGDKISLSSGVFMSIPSKSINGG